MICSELMSNKFDFNKVTFETCSSNCLEYLATKIEKDIEVYSKSTGQLSPPQLQGVSQDTTSGSNSSAIVRTQCAIREPRTLPGPYQSPEPNVPYQSPGPYQSPEPNVPYQSPAVLPTCHRQSPGQEQRFHFTTNISRGSYAEHKS